MYAIPGELGGVKRTMRSIHCLSKDVNVVFMKGLRLKLFNLV